MKKCIIGIAIIATILSGCSVAELIDSPRQGMSPTENIEFRNPFEEKLKGTNETEQKTDNFNYTYWPTEPNLALSPGEVSRVIDGDTIVISDGTRIRFTGIDTPEINSNSTLAPEPLAEEAKQFVEGIIQNQTIFLEIDPEHPYDPYERTLAYIWIDDKDNQELSMLNAMLVEAGLANALTIEPNTTYSHIFEELEKNAISKKLGIWK
ncbi:thermonuclease family protein [Alkalihalobacillus oceani]|uniref:Thermonuclease family protein n=1 Tax=Halalkalibacter oceani TaxID=1653776 RepID=A0A9X2DSD8_9BACI|nr:thermonuclease family protein [Halalkalibacter oceani]MCM3716069.1 thermonuclease family protein [Halalkalibacter oceani]